MTGLGVYGNIRKDYEAVYICLHTSQRGCDVDTFCMSGSLWKHKDVKD